METDLSDRVFWDWYDAQERPSTYSDIASLRAWRECRGRAQQAIIDLEAQLREARAYVCIGQCIRP